MIALIPTRPADTVRWLLPDLGFRLVPFAGLTAATWLVWRPPWLGLGPGTLRVQLTFGLVAMPVLFLLAAASQLALSRRRGALRVGAGADALLQASYYALNGPIEEIFFRGLLQGGLTVAAGPWFGFLVATGVYVLYHRLGGWWWPDVAATALLGIPLGLAFWLLPGPPSLIGVSLAHFGATCGFLGPGPYLLRRLGLL